MTYERNLRDGIKGIEDTICLMSKFVNDYKNNADIKLIVLSLKGKTKLETAQNIFDYINKNMRYVSDPDNIELVKSAKHTILGNSKYGDCDDLSTALATLLFAAGIPCVFRTIAWKPGKSLAFTHVYCIANIDGAEIPLDPSMGSKGFNNQIKFRKMKDWSITNGKTCWA